MVLPDVNFCQVMLMLRRLRISHRSALFFSLLGVITLSLGLFSVMQLNLLNDHVDDLGNMRLKQVANIEKMYAEFLYIRLQSVNFIMAVDADGRRNAQNLLQEARANYAKHESIMNSLVQSQKAKDLMAGLERDRLEYDQLLDQWFLLQKQDDRQGASRLREERIRPVALRITDQLSELSEYELATASRSVIDASNSSKHSIMAIYAAITFALAAVVVFAILFSRSLIVPIRNAVTLAQRVATGDLSLSVHDNANDEAADMIRALGRMQDQLRATIQHISDSSQQLATTSEELSAVTKDAGDIVHKQNAQLEQAATAVNELTVAIDEVANSASTTSSNSEQVNTKARTGQTKLDETIQTISNLVAEIGKTTDGISNLAGNVREISQVIDVIRGIAEQTNLLALNAAIEAARAGESGRGFAVVADEVRGLAHRTQESTKEIERMINAVQTATGSAVTNMETSNKWAASTLTMANELGESLSEITNLIGQINEQNLNIASAAEEQAMVAREVDQNLVAIRDLSFQTSAGANQTNTSSQELARLAEVLSDLMKKFRL